MRVRVRKKQLGWWLGIGLQKIMRTSLPWDALEHTTIFSPLSLITLTYRWKIIHRHFVTPHPHYRHHHPLRLPKPPPSSQSLLPVLQRLPPRPTCIPAPPSASFLVKVKQDFAIILSSLCLSLWRWLSSLSFLLHTSSASPGIPFTKSSFLAPSQSGFLLFLECLLCCDRVSEG